MKSLIVIIKSIFEPVSAFLFIAIGLLACLFSGIVEYHVLKQFFQIPSGITSAIPAEFWPLCWCWCWKDLNLRCIFTIRH